MSPLLLATLVARLLLPGIQAAPTQPAQRAPAEQPVTLSFRNLPFREAVARLFGDRGITNAVNADVPIPLRVSLNINEQPFKTAVRSLLRVAMESEPRLTMQQVDGAYIFSMRPINEADDTYRIDRVMLQSVSPAEAIRLAAPVLADGSVSSIVPLPNNDGLLVHATQKGSRDLKNLIRMIDPPARSLTLQASVTGLVRSGAPVSLRSRVTTLDGNDALIDETVTSGGQPTHLHVRLKPRVLDDGSVRVESEWDLSAPLSSGRTRSGSARLEKKLSSTTLVRPGRGAVVAEVDTRPWGGPGTVRLTITVEMAPEEMAAAR